MEFELLVAMSIIFLHKIQSTYLHITSLVPTQHQKQPHEVPVLLSPHTYTIQCTWRGTKGKGTTNLVARLPQISTSSLWHLLKCQKHTFDIRGELCSGRARTRILVDLRAWEESISMLFLYLFLNHHHFSLLCPTSASASSELFSFKFLWNKN